MSGDVEAIRRVLPRGRNALDRETVAASQQARILEAMQELVVEQGYAKVRVNDLVARAGVAKPTFYEHFGSKIGCFLALIENSFNEMIEGIAGSLVEDASVADRVEQGVGALVDYICDDPDRARVVIVEGPAAGSEVIDRLDGFFELLASFYIAMREISREIDPSIPPLPPLRARAIVGAVYEPIASTLRNGAVPDREELRTELVAVVKLLAEA